MRLKLDPSRFFVNGLILRNNTTPGYLKNDASGVVTGGNSLPLVTGTFSVPFIGDMITSSIDTQEINVEGSYVQWIAWGNAAGLGVVDIVVTYTDIANQLHNSEVIGTIDTSTYEVKSGYFYSRSTMFLTVTLGVDQSIGFALMAFNLGVA